MTGMARKFALTAITALALCGVPATAHADADPVNLPLTDAVRTDLVQAGAVLTGRPASGFIGLREGESYFAEDPANGVQWAAAALQANPGQEWRHHASRPEQLHVLHEGGPPGRDWVPTAIGFGPIPAGEERCPVPENVRALWGWPSGKCYPPPAAMREMSPVMKTLVTAMVIAAAAVHHHRGSTRRRPRLPVHRGVRVLRHRRTIRPNGDRPNPHLTATPKRYERERHEACFDSRRRVACRPRHRRLRVAAPDRLLVVIEFDCPPIESKQHHHIGGPHTRSDTRRRSGRRAWHRRRALVAGRPRLDAGRLDPRHAAHARQSAPAR